jgi:hypothetical protein
VVSHKNSRLCPLVNKGGTTFRDNGRYDFTRLNTIDNATTVHAGELLREFAWLAPKTDPIPIRLRMMY